MVRCRIHCGIDPARSPPLTMWSTAATICAKITLASASGSRPSFEIFVKSSPPPAYSMTRCSFASVSTTSYSRMMLAWCSRSMLEISRDSRRCVFWSSFVLSRILIATFSAHDGGGAASRDARVTRDSTARVTWRARCRSRFLFSS